MCSIDYMPGGSSALSLATVGLLVLALAACGPHLPDGKASLTVHDDHVLLDGERMDALEAGLRIRLATSRGRDVQVEVALHAGTPARRLAQVRGRLSLDDEQRASGAFLLTPGTSEIPLDAAWIQVEDAEFVAVSDGRSPLAPIPMAELEAYVALLVAAAPNTFCIVAGDPAGPAVEVLHGLGIKNMHVVRP